MLKNIYVYLLKKYKDFELPGSFVKGGFVPDMKKYKFPENKYEIPGNSDLFNEDKISPALYNRINDWYKSIYMDKNFKLVYSPDKEEPVFFPILATKVNGNKTLHSICD